MSVKTGLGAKLILPHFQFPVGTIKRNLHFPITIDDAGSCRGKPRQIKDVETDMSEV